MPAPRATGGPTGSPPARWARNRAPGGTLRRRARQRPARRRRPPTSRPRGDGIDRFRSERLGREACGLELTVTPTVVRTGALRHQEPGRRGARYLRGRVPPSRVVWGGSRPNAEGRDAQPGHRSARGRSRRMHRRRRPVRPGLDATAPTPAPSSTPSSDPAGPSDAPSGAAGGCIISIPQQVEADLTPVVISYPGADDATCAGYLATQIAKGTGVYAKAHPPTRVSTVPAGAPVCSVTSHGIKHVVYGTRQHSPPARRSARGIDRRPTGTERLSLPLASRDDVSEPVRPQTPAAEAVRRHSRAAPEPCSRAPGPPAVRRPPRLPGPEEQVERPAERLATPGQVLVPAAFRPARAAPAGRDRPAGSRRNGPRLATGASRSGPTRRRCSRARGGGLGPRRRPPPRSPHGSRTGRVDLRPGEVLGIRLGAPERLPDEAVATGAHRLAQRAQVPRWPSEGRSSSPRDSTRGRKARRLRAVVGAVHLEDPRRAAGARRMAEARRSAMRTATCRRRPRGSSAARGTAEALGESEGALPCRIRCRGRADRSAGRGG